MSVSEWLSLSRAPSMTNNLQGSRTLFDNDLIKTNLKYSTSLARVKWPYITPYINKLSMFWQRETAIRKVSKKRNHERLTKTSLID